MGFIDKKNRKPPQEEANDMVQLAICMIQVIRKVKKQINFPELNMRIGIHTVSLRSSRETSLEESSELRL
jgi:hypothetical protein